MPTPIDIGKEFKLGGEEGKGIGELAGYESIGALISNILPNVYVVAGILLLFILIFTGLAIIFSGGGGTDPEKLKKANQAFTAALAGLLIIFASYWIIQVVEVITGLEIFKGGGL